MFAIGHSNFLQALGWAVLNSLWQMALLWVVYQLATALLRTNKSSQRGFLSTLLLFAGFGWFVFTFFSILADKPASETGYSAFITINGNDSVNNWLYTMLPVASIFYLVLLTLPILNFIRNYRYVQVIRNLGLKKADVKWRMFAQKIAAQMGIVKSVQVWMSEFVTSPVTIGYIKPIILLPVAAINHLSAEQIEAVLLHELSHIKRFDYLINLITRIIQTILYFNPFVRAFAVIIEREREKNCDEIVLQFQYEPHGYATALLALEQASYLPHPLAIAAADGKKNELLGRIESILGIQKKPVLSFNKLAGIMAALLCFISLNALLLLSKPGESAATPGLLTDLSGPFHLFTPGNESMLLSNESKELKSIPVANHTAPSPTQPTQNPKTIVLAPKTAPEPSVHPVIASPFMNVNFKENVIPELDEQKKEQVKEVLDASKKVLGEEQWKVMEKNIADAMTTHEKEKLKSEYQKAISKLDWEKMENKLRVAYDNINWKEINSELNNALVEIKLDSIQQVFTVAVSNLASLERELVKCNEPGIPDTDITLKSVECKKKEVLKVINILKSTRARKVVRL